MTVSCFLVSNRPNRTGFPPNCAPKIRAQFIAGLTVTHAEQHQRHHLGPRPMANRRREYANARFFFRRSDDRLQQIATSSQFWGEQQTKLADWGLLKIVGGRCRLGDAVAVSSPTSWQMPAMAGVMITTRLSSPFEMTSPSQPQRTNSLAVT